jgi:phosphoglycerol transferase MdoB-like AlkP superfamily enzyme
VKALFSRTVGSRQGGTVLLALTYVLLGSLLRLGFLVASTGGVSWGLATFGALFVGFAFDVVMAWFLTLPLGLLATFWPKRFWRFPLVVAWTFGAFLFSFWKISEILFWEEFGVRFNFIAVDYLVYTTEVVKNIKESYNLPLIAAAVALLAFGAYLLWRRLGLTAAWHAGAATDTSPRWRTLVGLLAPFILLLGVAYATGRHDLKVASPIHSSFGERLTAGLRHMGDPQPSWANSYDTEIAKNGEYAFLAAFWANQLDWKRFYPSREGVVPELAARLSQQGAPLDPSKPSDILRKVAGTPGARKLNVIQITIESLSAKFLGCYGVNDEEDRTDYGKFGLTPNLDRISQESLWFTHCYAGGTRTVRGMEALTLSIPPIPGQSVLRRKGCENLSTLGSALAAQGYDTAFIYGGDGFFDNMSYFFGANGYRIVDQPAALKAGRSVSFGNAWGACDEDAFNWSMAEADEAHAAGKPFHHFIMTTSNHRPYTWPAGKIRPELRDRPGGVAYTDYAIGAFLRQAAAKPWFKDTVFVIVADHCASVAGKRELEIKKYEIPLFIWAPGLLPARKVDDMMSQIDLVPTLLGLLKLPYAGRFVGADVLAPGYRPRAFISNYQKVAVLRPDGLLTVLKPVRQVAQFRADLATGTLVPLTSLDADAAAEAIQYYQGTDELFNRGGLANPAR